MRYGVWLLMFAKGTDANRQSMKCHQLRFCMGNTTQLGGASGDVFSAISQSRDGCRDK